MEGRESSSLSGCWIGCHCTKHSCCYAKSRTINGARIAKTTSQGLVVQSVRVLQSLCNVCAEKCKESYPKKLQCILSKFTVVGEFSTSLLIVRVCAGVGRWGEKIEWGVPPLCLSI